MFPCMWLDYVHKGSCNTRWGSTIGIPAHMISTLDLINKVIDSGRLGNFKVDFESSHGQNLLKSLEMMTDVNVKKFCLAKAMCEVDLYHDFVIAGMIAGTIPAAYFTAKFFQLVTGFYANPLLRRMSYVVVFPSVFLAHIFLKDAYHCRTQEKTDDKLASLGPDMAKGGADYYSALLLRNQALLALCGKLGAKNITYYGNVRSSWRRPEPLLTERRDKMLSYSDMPGKET